MQNRASQQMFGPSYLAMYQAELALAKAQANGFCSAQRKISA